jgi:hypothetical protein
MGYLSPLALIIRSSQRKACCSGSGDIEVAYRCAMNLCTEEVLQSFSSVSQNSLTLYWLTPPPPSPLCLASQKQQVLAQILKIY